MITSKLQFKFSNLAIALGMSLFVISLAPTWAFAHGGGLDSAGCHHDRKHGGYHCHRAGYVPKTAVSPPNSEYLQYSPSVPMGPLPITAKPLVAIPLAVAPVQNTWSSTLQQQLNCVDRKVKIFNARQNNKFEVQYKVAQLQGRQFIQPSAEQLVFWLGEAQKAALSTCNAEVVSFETGRPSFDCANPTKSSESMICGSKELAGLDTQLSNAFYAHKYFSSNKAAMLLETRAWLSERDNCSDAGCLGRMYKQRLLDIENRLQ